jgi:hypothetical protein
MNQPAITHRHHADPARVSAHIDDEAVTGHTGLDCVAERLHDLRRVQEKIEAHVADIAFELSGLEPDVRCGQVSKVRRRAFRSRTDDVPFDTPITGVEKCDMYRGSGGARELRENRAREIQLARRRVAVELRYAAQRCRQFNAIDAVDLPAGAHAFFRGLGDGCPPIENANVETRSSVRGLCCLQVAISIGRDQLEVRLAETADHFAHDGARLGHGARAFDFRTQLVARGVPIDTAEVLVPVLIADGRPDELEGFQVETLLLRGERGLRQRDGGATDCDERAARQFPILHCTVVVD